VRNDASPLGKKQKSLGLGAAVVAAALWGFGGIIVKLASSSALALSFYRLWIGAVALAVITLATGRRVTWMTMKYSWLGGLLFAGDLLTFYSAVKLTSIVVASLIGRFNRRSSSCWRDGCSANRSIAGRHLDRLGNHRGRIHGGGSQVARSPTVRR